MSIAVSLGKSTPFGYFSLNITLFTPTNVQVGVIALPSLSISESDIDGDNENYNGNYDENNDDNNNNDRNQDEVKDENCQFHHNSHP